jgi:hypothetical protein
MADYQPDKVISAARSLDASRTEMREVNARWQRMLRSRSFPRGRRRLQLVLGPPVTVADHPLGDVVCRTARWPLPLWPDLLFEALTAPDGAILREWLIRPEGARPPRPGTVAELTPWSCVVGDVAGRFGPATHRAGTTPSRWHVAFPAPDGDRERSYVAHFVWGLLQAVEEVPGGGTGGT